MAVLMKGRSLASLTDLTREEIEQILKTSELLKFQMLRGQEHPLLKGKTLAMIFEKPSTRTRVSFEVGMWQLGGYALYLSSSDLQLGRGETIANTTQVLSRYKEFLKRLGKKITILHALLRFDEISPEVDSYPGAAYFRQVRNGVFVRMALLAMVLGKR
jgi:aspartate carbamoyltransferase catalytic subunit